MENREVTDYCAMFGEDDIQGKKPRFLAGNKVNVKKLKHFSHKLSKFATETQKI